MIEENISQDLRQNNIYKTKKIFFRRNKTY